jgi:GMP synthase-like glutamine amidotransferase
MRVVVVRHHDSDNSGLIGAAFEARGAELDLRLFPDDGPLPDPAGADHIVVLGAYPSVYDDLPWIAAELAWLRQADASGVPILGICFGAQGLCAALGGQVELSPRKELGWTTIESLDPDLVPAGPWLEFHGDRCVLPPDARLLAVNDVCAQAFAIGRHLGIQFHPEVDGEQLKRWLDGGATAHVVQMGLDPDEFLAQTIHEEPAARIRAAHLVTSALTLAHQPG